MIRVDEATTRAADVVASAAPGVFDRLDRFNRANRHRAGAHARCPDGPRRYAPRHAHRARPHRSPARAGQRPDGRDQRGAGANDFKGTLGRLVNDPKLGDTLVDVTESGRDAVASFNRFRTWLGMRVEFDVFSRDVRFYATAEIRARNDKFYLIELERGPLGGLPADQLSDVTGSDAYTRQQVTPDKVRFTAQYGKQLGRFSLRGGLKDSTPGAGVDALMLDGRLKLSADVFGAYEATPRLKLAGALACSARSTSSRHRRRAQRAGLPVDPHRQHRRAEELRSSAPRSRLLLRRDAGDQRRRYHDPSASLRRAARRLTVTAATAPAPGRRPRRSPTSRARTAPR